MDSVTSINLHAERPGVSLLAEGCTVESSDMRACGVHRIHTASAISATRRLSFLFHLQDNRCKKYVTVVFPGKIFPLDSTLVVFYPPSPVSNSKLHLRTHTMFALQPHDEGKITTWVLILSDTHGEMIPASLGTLPPVDVVIHCGDLTDESKLAEFTSTFNHLRDIKASLKLVIAGNHDFTLDKPSFAKIVEQSNLASDQDAIREVYGDIGHGPSLLQRAKLDFGITFLDEGTHKFDLPNGARLRIFASPYTPSKDAGWGFQYCPSPVYVSSNPSDSQQVFNDGHEWCIDDTTDVVLTHGPPHGVLDRTRDMVRGGSQGLFAAIERSRPQLHCFGHIHEGWGAKSVAWREKRPSSVKETGIPSHFTSIDNGSSTTIETLATLTPRGFDTADVARDKSQRMKAHRDTGACIAAVDASSLGARTLFVNAAIQGEFEGQDGSQLPWLVHLDLPKAVGSDVAPDADQGELADQCLAT